MPPLSEWFEGQDRVGVFIEHAVFGPARPGGIALREGCCNSQPAFATYQPDHGRLAVNGLQIVELADVGGRIAVRTLVSYRDPALAARCGLPPTIPGPL
jgi:hypothetical protein